MSMHVCKVLVATETPFVPSRSVPKYESSGGWLRRQVSMPWGHILNVDHTISFMWKRVTGASNGCTAHTLTHTREIVEEKEGKETVEWQKKLNKVQLIFVAVAVVTPHFVRCSLSNEIYSLKRYVYIVCISHTNLFTLVFDNIKEDNFIICCIKQHCCIGCFCFVLLFFHSVSLHFSLGSF